MVSGKYWSRTKYTTFKLCSLKNFVDINFKFKDFFKWINLVSRYVFAIKCSYLQNICGVWWWWWWEPSRALGSVVYVWLYQDLLIHTQFPPPPILSTATTATAAWQSMTVHDSLDGVEITNNYTSNAPHHHQHYCHCSGKINLFNLYPFVQLCLAVQFFSYMFLRGKTKHLK